MNSHDRIKRARYAGDIVNMNGRESQHSSYHGFSPPEPETISRILDGTLYTRTTLPFFANGGYILLRVRSGEGKLISGDLEYPMTAGYILLYRTNLPAAVEPSGEFLSLTAFHLISDLGELFHEDKPIHRFPETTEFTCALQRSIRRLVLTSSACARDEDPVIEMIKALCRAAETGPDKPLIPPYYIAAMKNILDTRYAERISLDSISKELHINKFKLAKEFKALFSSAPIEYLISRRIESAAKLLFATDRSVTEIAANVAMENVSYFVRRFRETYGMTPLRYRMNSRAESEEFTLHTTEEEFSSESAPA